MTQIWGHRGAKGYRPENTLISFEEALNQGADGIELDIHLSADGYLMVCHDETVDRTSDGTGYIREKTYKELRQLDFGKWYGDEYTNTRIPSLEEVLEFMKGNNMALNVEIKAGSVFYPGIEEEAVEMLHKYNMMSRTVISSFDHYALVSVKEADPRFKTGILYEARLYRAIDYMKTVKADALHPNYIAVTDDIIAKAAGTKTDINTYTVNNMNAVRYLSSVGIHAIITDYPKDAVSTIAIDTVTGR